MTHPTDDELEAMTARLDKGDPFGGVMQRAAAMLRACKGRVRVKPLEWLHSDETLRFYASWRAIDYLIEDRTQHGRGFNLLFLSTGVNEVFLTLDAAIAAAQADYAARILAALEPAPDHAEWDAAIEAAAQSVKGRSDNVRKKMSEAYDLGNIDLVHAWLAVISHLDLAQEGIVNLKKGQTND